MNKTPFLRRLRVIHLALTTGILLTAFISYMYLKPGSGIAGGQSFYLMAGLATAFFMAVLSLLLYKQKTRDAALEKTLADKLEAYQNGYIITLAMIEGPALLNLVLYGVGGPDANFYVAIALLLLLVGRYPGSTRIADELKLTMQEKELLEKV